MMFHLWAVVCLCLVSFYAGIAFAILARGFFGMNE